MAGKQKGLIPWDQQLAKDAEIAAGMEDSASSGQFFRMKAGVLTFNDAPIPGNHMAVIILDGVLENTFYESSFDQDNPQGPSCFAFARNEKDLAPHQVVVEAKTAQGGEGGTCEGCPMNEWASAETGKGKACRNGRRLAMISAGNLDQTGRLQPITDPEHFEATGIALMKLPPTSVKGYGGFVRNLSGVLKRPPHGVITKVSVVPDAKTQFKVVFEPIQKVSDQLMAIVMKRRAEAMKIIDLPYQAREEAPAPVAKPRRQAAPQRVQRQAPTRQVQRVQPKGKPVKRY